jgi:tetratricopeptide (TPR) repeat protein
MNTTPPIDTVDSINLNAEYQSASTVDWHSFTPAREAFWVQNDAQKALTLLPVNLDDHEQVALLPSKIQRMAVDLIGQLRVKTGLLDDAINLYTEHQRWEQATACALYQDNASLAVQFLEPLAQQGKTTFWADILYCACTNQLSTWPHFLHLRNRLENDLTFFYLYNRLDYMDSLLAYLNSFAHLNPEVFKLAGRTLVYLGLREQGTYLLKQSLEQNPFDAENYYHLAECALLDGLDQDARRFLKQVCWINPAYTPARDLLHTLTLKA